ncbi:heptaprenyl diphosphate synthase component 1 [Bacillus sp. DTU_2020_1000418_1_SI_GHA_SEK_038]|uniref:heptaprenyl diphosphate synthase component 1 n=1 Tax=Bacillus sp. DTU_2020_1000418_1_SI_GHA_SEK_038 TaxID=3077585 RepID=UPI0028ECFB9A|nr:heptaprenyl diphosphate synthase component 1 [Bacillus sp. DTU_2020_1000418_1_SI_GHA_SEK_038]WNS74035.1 heptaprenyl diphosphate synthase component 1 [Bacillus sp. DTU_2020_1000418_1_SI_GHA_SEK_038]
MLDMKVKMAIVKEQIEEKIRHPYLLKYIESPNIDEDKLLLLVSVLDHMDLPEEKIRNYATTTMLIQIALDTHELVTNEELDAGQLKSRQLTVLAGVYYSGLYYKILAEFEDITLIRSLATGIKEVNENKISVYQTAVEAVDILMESVRKIESSLFEKVIDLLEDPNWNEFASNLLFRKRLLMEKMRFLQGETSIVFEALKNLLISKNQYTEQSSDQQHLLIHTCDRYLDNSKKLIEKYMSKLPNLNEPMKQRANAIISQHQPAENIFVEEG